MAGKYFNVSPNILYIRMSIYDTNKLPVNELRLPCNEWADDSHYFHVNPKIKIEEE